ncbi:MAG: P-loop NTPase [Bacteroidales bacterium]|nr:P-loop NTPase [Bacteroidales bacterium]
MKIAIASGKGGTGKTFVATNLFYVAVKNGRNVTLADCDAEEPNVEGFLQGKPIRKKTVSQNLAVIDPEKCVYCGKCRDWCIYNAIICLEEQQKIYLLEDLCHDCGACLVACKFDAISETERRLGTVTTSVIEEDSVLTEARADVGIYSSVPVIKAALTASGTPSLLLMDAPPGISCPFITTVAPADFVVLVTEPTPFGLNDLKLSVETLEQLGKPYGVVVNRDGLGDHKVYDWLEEKNIPLLMKIPFDREIARIYSQSLLVAAEDDSYAKQFLLLLQKIEALCKN